MGDETQNEINYLLAWRAAEFRDYYKTAAEQEAVMLVASRPDLLFAATVIARRLQMAAN